MACNSAWANQRLLRAVALLSPEEFAAPRVSFFPSLASTLNHNLTVDWFYVDALRRALDGDPPNPEPGSFFDPEVPFGACDALTAAQQESDRRLIELCSGLGDEELALGVGIKRQGGIKTETVLRLLGHLFQHQIHHRGQAHAMLAGTRVAPPSLDEFFCANEAHKRADDLAELGLSEELVWERR